MSRISHNSSLVDEGSLWHQSWRKRIVVNLLSAPLNPCHLTSCSLTLPSVWETACCWSQISLKSVKSDLALLWFCFTSLCYWSRKLAPLSQPIRFTTKSKCDAVARVFPRFRQFAAFTLSLHWLPRIFFLFLICRWDNFGLFFFQSKCTLGCQPKPAFVPWYPFI